MDNVSYSSDGKKTKEHINVDKPTNMSTFHVVSITSAALVTPVLKKSKTPAQRQREYRLRLKLKKAQHKIAKTPAQRQREYRLRLKLKKTQDRIAQGIKPDKKTRADYQREYRERKKLSEQKSAEEKDEYLQSTALILPQLTTSPDTAPKSKHHEAVSETAKRNNKSREQPKDTSSKMAEDIDIEEHDVLNNPQIKNMFPDPTRIKTEVLQEGDECPNGDFAGYNTNVTIKVEPHTIEVEYPQFSDIENVHLKALVKEPKMKEKNTVNKLANDIDIEEHNVLDNSQIQNMFPDMTRIKTEVMQEGDELPFGDFADHNTIPFKIDPQTIKAEYPQSDSEIIQESEICPTTIVPKIKREDHEHLDATALIKEPKRLDNCKMEDKKNYVCATCRVNFVSQRTLIQHKCTSVRSKTCNVCNKKIDHESFKVHYALHEENRTKSETMMMKHESIHAIWNILYQCAVCSTVTDSYDVAVEHSQAHYSQMESFGVILQNCDICKLAFKSDCYQKHKELHQGAKLNRESFNIVQFNYLHLHSAKWFEMFRLLEPKILDLILSTSMYKDTRSVRMKMLQDGNNGDTMYLCVSCNRIVDAKDVKTHAFNENICSDVEFRQCAICQYKFASEAQFNQHSNGTHGNIKAYRILVFNSVEDQVIITAMRNNTINEVNMTLADNFKKPIILRQRLSICRCDKHMKMFTP